MSEATDDRLITLHEEIQAILRENGSVMPAPDIAKAVNRRGRYSKRDSSMVSGGQVHARVSKRRDLFVRDAGGIGLVEW